MADVEMQPVAEVSRKRTASSSQSVGGGIKKQKLQNIRKIPVPSHRLVKTLGKFSKFH